MEQIKNYVGTYFDWFYIPRIKITDIIEIIFIAILVYYIMDWFKKTRAWTLIKGILILVALMGIAALFEFNTLLWIFQNPFSFNIDGTLFVSIYYCY